MQSEDLLDLIGEIKDEHIQDAKAQKRRAFPTWAKWAAGAAACLIIAAVGAALLQSRNTPDAGAPPEAGGGSGHCEGAAFMSYAGPVFPLTLMEGEEGLEAGRAVTFDFSTYTEAGADIEVWTGGGGVMVRDAYRLTNLSREEKAVAGVYPIAGDYQAMQWPSIEVDGVEVEYELHSGSYAGGFTGAGDEHTSSVNLDPLNSWEEYQALLVDGSYFAEAFTEPAELDQPVIVYEFTDITDGDCGYDAATLRVRYRYDSGRTNIMTYGFNGAGDDPETGEGIRSFFIREGLRSEDEETKYLIVAGEDIKNMSLQGYRDGGCEAGEEVEGPAAAVARRESTMGEILRAIARGLYDEISGSEFDGDHNRYLGERISFDMYYADICKHFAAYGPMGADPKERYSFEWGARLEDIIGETSYRERIFYLTFPITVPAGGSVELEVEQYKPSSFDFSCSGSQNVGVDGYDMVTNLGSCIVFTGQRAAVENHEGIEIARQNFGFDLANGVTEVALDMDQPRYYLEVREAAAPAGG